MRKFLAFIVLLIAGTIALGFYLGWFQFSTTQEGDRSNITISVDKNKIQADKDKAVEKLQDFGDKTKTPPPADQPPPPPTEAEPQDDTPEPPEQP